MAERPADTKRQKISKAQQLTMLEVLATSLVLGTCLVLSIFLIKYIKFNTKIITEKNEAITEYDQTLRNVGICLDKDKNGRLSDEELEKCKPNEIKISEVPGTLRYNVYQSMAQNSDLESVARKRNANCYNEKGERIDFNELYSQATSDKDREQYLQAAKICSALRVISDALPAQKNTEALMASLNQIFIVAGKEPDSIAPRDENLELDDIVGVSAVPVTLQYEGTGVEVIHVLDSIERSIREFDITSATIEWTERGLSLSARANAFYLSELDVLEENVTVKPKGKTKPSTGAGDRGSSAVDNKNQLLESTK